MELKQIVWLAFMAVFSCVYSTLVFISLLFRPKWLLRGFLQKSKFDQPPKCLADESLGTHGYIHLEEVRIHYVAAGTEGKPLMLLVHGFPEFWYSWRYQLREFSKEYRVVAIDQRGYGDSDKPSGVSNYTTEKLSQDLKQLIPALGYRDCVLVGHDWGGAIVFKFANMYPEMVKKLVVLNAPHGAVMFEDLMSNCKQFFKSWFLFFLQMPYLPEFLLEHDSCSAFDMVFQDQDKKRIKNCTEEDVEAYKYTFGKKENLALKKPTHQQFRYPGLAEALSQSSNAVDGLKSNLSVWGGQCTISANEKQTALWYVDLENIFNIHHINIYYRTENVFWGPSNIAESLPSRFLGFSLYISNTTDKSTGKLCFKDSNFTTSTIPAVFNITCPVKGRFVIYYNERSSDIVYPNGYSTYAYNELCELEVFGCPEFGYYGTECDIPCPDANCRSCHRETGTCLDCLPGYQGNNCEIQCGYGKHGDRCQENCGQCADVIQCQHVNGTCLGGCKQGYIRTDCKSCENRTYGPECNITCGHCLNQDYCHHVYGTCFSGCEPGFGGNLCKTHNLAFNKPTYQYFRYTALSAGLTSASNAVDGLKSDLSVWGGQCVISSDRKQTATWWVNLSRIHSIHHVTIYYRTGNVVWGTNEGFTSRFLGFSLYVSNTTNKSDGTLCFKDTSFTLSTIPAVFNTTCPLLGQYVIYYNERLTGVTYPDGYSTYAYNELCELEVYGCPEAGYYGPECSIPCPDPHCRYCHMETGICQGCEPGYEGHHCESECSYGKHGYGCEVNCGRCSDLKQCHHINGTCFGGCEQGYTGEECMFCDNRNYGEGCNIPCGHCLNQGYCYYVNGKCLSGCEPGFSGELCKSINLAFNKPAFQQYPYVGVSENLTDASNAVDGLKSNLSVWGGQCVISKVKQQIAIWWVNLTSILNIHYITIYYRTGNVAWGPNNNFASRFLGFSLYVSNTTSKSDGTLCFKDTHFNLDTIPAVFNSTCIVLGQYVIFYNERLSGVTYPDGYSQYAYNELCEVEVIGCPKPGYYGFNCSIPCPDPHCRYCHMETGTCRGCEAGYEGHRCESECAYGKHGFGCEMNCGHCTDLKQCHRANGTCFGGCQQGYIGEDCKFCGNGNYGEGCDMPCGHCLNQDYCYHDTGACLSGCEPGYHGDQCKSYNLALKKPSHQHHRYTGLPKNLTEASNAVDGLKSDLSVWGGQCVSSQEGLYNATWWVNLTSIIGIHHIMIYYRTGNQPWGQTNNFASRFLGFSLYVSNTTNKSDGTLCFKDTNFTKSTIPAVFNITCLVHGQYVIYYNERLPGVTYPDGYSEFAYNELCEVEVFACPSGFFGHSCLRKCSSTCNGCNTVNGLCDAGCLAGWKGSNCKEPCSCGKYGPECNNSCGHCLEQKDCHNVNGSCLTGCKPGFSGVHCNSQCKHGFHGKTCSSKCGHCLNGDSCHRINGSCLLGCDPGYQGIFCTIEKSNTSIETYVALAISSILLVIALAVIVFQRRLISNLINERKSKETTQNQGQIIYENNQHLYDISTAADEKHKYVTLEPRKQESYYQNIN